MQPKTISLTHANLGTKMEVAVALIAGWFPSSADKFTYVVASGGASFPAKESVDEISRLYNSATNGQQVAMTPVTPNDMGDVNKPTTGITRE